MRRALKVLIRSLLILFVAGYGLLLLFNGAPKAPPVPSDRGEAKSPMVVKIHARWCPVCMASKPAWLKLQKTFGGRVQFVIFDVTSQASKNASRVEAARLGLEEFFEAHGEQLGSVFVLNGASKEVQTTLGGLHGYATYATCIEDALKNAAVQQARLR